MLQSQLLMPVVTFNSEPRNVINCFFCGFCLFVLEHSKKVFVKLFAVKQKLTMCTKTFVLQNNKTLWPFLKLVFYS